MKNDKLIYSIGCILVIAGSIMKILHLPFANAMVTLSLVGMFIFQFWHVTELKKRIKELENKTEQ